MSKKKQEEGGDALPYEEVIERLEGLVEKLETGELSLDDQIHTFEEGIRLVRRGQTLLDEAERRVEILLNTEGEETAPFEADA